jgi:hypothetical protein
LHRTRQYALFKHHKEKDVVEPQSTTIKLHPSAPEITKNNLTFDDLELIFHETHTMDECFEAYDLYGLLADMCPPETRFSVQIGSEVCVAWPDPKLQQ